MLGRVQIEGVLGRVVAVSGPETVLADRAVDGLVEAGLQQRPDAQVTKVDAPDLDLGRFLELTGGSLFTSATIVVIREASELAPELVDAVVAAAKSPTDEVGLIVVHPGGAKGKGVIDKLKAARCEVIDCPTIKQWELPQFASAEARRAGGRLDGETARALVEALGSDAAAVAGAVRQLLSDSPDSHITPATVRRYFAGRADVTSFSVADAALGGRSDAALGALRWALETGVPPVLVTSAMASGLRNLGRYLEASGGRQRDADLARSIGVPPWKVKDIAQQSRDWTPAGVARALLAVAKADADTKGAASDPAFALEQLVLTVGSCRGRGRR